MLYGNPCAVSMKSIHVKAKNSMKRIASLAMLRGVGFICKAIYKYENVESPFDDSESTDCATVANMIINVSVEGTFYADTLAPGELDITRPVLLKKNVNKGKSKLILFETIKLPSMTYMTLMMVLRIQWNYQIHSTVQGCSKLYASSS